MKHLAQFDQPLACDLAMHIGEAVQEFHQDLEARDQDVLAASTVAGLAIALVAAFLPARKASRVDPVVALKAE